MNSDFRIQNISMILITVVSKFQCKYSILINLHTCIQLIHGHFFLFSDQTHNVSSSIKKDEKMLTAVENKTKKIQYIYVFCLKYFFIFGLCI